MSNDQNHDIFEDLDFEGIERGDDETSDEVESQKSPIIQPVLDKFRERFLFDTLVDCIETCGVEKARDALRVDRVHARLLSAPTPKRWICMKQRSKIFFNLASAIST